MKDMEIERKWLVSDWPAADLPIRKEEYMRQGYVTTDPTVRIREERTEKCSAGVDNPTVYMLCFKSRGGLSRREIEFPIPEAEFSRLEDFIGLPLIEKVRRTYILPDGHYLEVNLVDRSLPSVYRYAEIEFDSEEEAVSWRCPEVLKGYLDREVTDDSGETMAAYWTRTRGDLS